ncbi:SET domain-containing protein [Colletotrichum tofieldiae]|nr:SET domain-containing protein [Colletotrichum tofieldiae]
MVDLSGIISQNTTNSPNASNLGRENVENSTPPTISPQMMMDEGPASSSRSMPLVRAQRTPSQGPQLSFESEPAGSSSQRRGTGALRPVRGAGRVLEEEPDSQRRMQVTNNFPKRTKTLASDTVFTPQQSSIEKFVVSIWEQIHGGISLDPQSLLEQWQLTATAATATINNAGKIHVPEQLELGLLQAPTADGTMAEIDMEGTFNRSNIFCRKVTQASRACRSIEVIVQARWIEHFDSYVELLAITNPGMSPTKRRKAALIEACNDFGWSEKELRNKMAIWRGYKEIKDAGVCSGSDACGRESKSLRTLSIPHGGSC